jgi:hypothetical protein
MLVVSNASQIPGAAGSLLTGLPVHLIPHSHFAYLQEVEAFAKSARVTGARTLMRMGTSMRAMRRRMSSSGL